MDYNKYFSEGGSYAIDQTIKGQSGLQMYDPLAQMVYKPENKLYFGTPRFVARRNSIHSGYHI